MLLKYIKIITKDKRDIIKNIILSIRNEPNNEIKNRINNIIDQINKFFL